ncbi:HesA/MoeB/ThiF family protein [Paracoccus sp. 1_MG-2023]|uniref:HesA/MoeB/ThiF family protein n=1 Tax=unclassified Paracoccus (in: a-proteobacteria) TaxID=2688777 RepID=UPI001C0A327C|nr:MULTISPECIES: HesA/MoeB/ThiF family protein [unclassified Paracoccus (in: a-proteobacteria)]MBU2958198.1 HesA/MoeB/ThiF family protein [Paracoccus sp. C2R09]MDO6668325.1 HesA/MoeB/ThiF family protein [Paracoccus sp. 1_MG-2023]
MLGLWLIVVLLILGRVMRAPGRVMIAATGAVWAVMLLVQLAAPDSGLGRALGGSAAGWLVLGGVVALALAYRAGLRRLRARAAPDRPEPAPDAGMSDAEIDRYSRHLVLHEIGGPGQMRLRGARVLIVGAGGLGTPVCLYLAAAGVGRITLADDDTVSLSNLQRQVIFRDDLQGEPKAYAAAEAMLRLNPHLDVTPLTRRITQDDIELIAGHDLVIDGTDSHATRSAINRACVAAGVPLVWGAIGRWEGQLTLFDPARGGPCMNCIFPEAPVHDAPCAEAGVVGALPGVIGSMMALEAVKELTGAGQGMRGRLMIHDALYSETRVIRTSADPACTVCGPSAPKRSTE